MADKNLKIHWPMLVLGIFVAVVFFSILFLFTVAETDYAIMERFGSPIREEGGGEGKVKVYKPGLHFKIPFIDQVWKHDKRSQVYQLKRGQVEQMQTSDDYQLIATTFVVWNVGDIYRFYKSVGTTDNAQEKLDEIVRNSRNNVIGKRPLNEFINVDSSKLDIEGIEQEILEDAAPVARDEYGIEIDHIAFRHLGFPQDVTVKVFERMEAERKAQAQKYRSRGDKEATEIRARADLEAQRILADARAEATEIRAEGDRAAAEFYSAFQENPQLASFLRKLEALEKTLADKTTLILDTQTVPYDLLLPGAIDLESLEETLKEADPERLKERLRNQPSTNLETE
ncbi:MAG: protease modulator HflC [Verrucomicrobiota bacterium]